MKFQTRQNPTHSAHYAKKAFPKKAVLQHCAPIATVKYVATMQYVAQSHNETQPHTTSGKPVVPAISPKPKPVSVAQYPIQAPSAKTVTSLQITHNYDAQACDKCVERANEARAAAKQKSLEKEAAGIEVPKGGTTAAQRRSRQDCEKVERTAPTEGLHGPASARLAQDYIHSPYELPNEAVAPWDGECKHIEICTMIQECICHITEAVPKHLIACLDWVNKGQCTPRAGMTRCEYAHPDLTNMHPDICCNFYLTGICRFLQSEEECQAPKPRPGRNRGQQACNGCHCVKPDVFPLLPGLTKKILRTEGKKEKIVVRTLLDRALDMYKSYLGY